MRTNQGTADFGFPIVPALLPGETVYSYFSRLHALTGHSRAETTATMLFGRKRSGMQHDFPEQIPAFCSRTGDMFGPVDQLILERTILPYYLAWCAPEDRSELIDLARLGGKALKSRLGMMAARFRAHHPLKACADCMRQEMQEAGQAHWHLSHQYPGAWVCLDHGVPLLELNAKANGVERFQWLLPQIGSHSSQTWLELAEVNLEFAFAMSTAAVVTAEFGKSASLDRAKVGELCREELIRRELASRSGRLRIAEIQADYANFVRPLASIREFNGLFFRGIASDVTRYLRAPRGYIHPIRHLSIVLWLFGSAEEFLGRYHTIGKSDEPSRSAEPAPFPGSDAFAAKRDHYMNAALLGKWSATRLAREAGVNVTTAQAWLAAAGRSSSRRPKTFSALDQDKAIRLLQKGATKAVVADKVRVSLQSVTRLLRTEPGLRAQWNDATFEANLASARKKWTREVARHPGLSTKFLRQLAPAEYAWLYRNDREWLSNHRVQHPASRKPRHRYSVDWQSRDADCAQMIREAALALNSKGIERPSIGRLCQEIPLLRPRLSEIDKLPQTRKALEIVARHRRCAGAKLPL